jgi:hypothetical protein
MVALAAQVTLVASNLRERLESALAMELSPELRALLEMAEGDANALLECARRATGSEVES